MGVLSVANGGIFYPTPTIASLPAGSIGVVSATGGTLLQLSESGFDKIPGGRRAEAFRMNDGGWTEQMENIRRHVA